MNRGIWCWVSDEDDNDSSVGDDYDFNIKRFKMVIGKDLKWWLIKIKNGG